MANLLAGRILEAIVFFTYSFLYFLVLNTVLISSVIGLVGAVRSFLVSRRFRKTESSHIPFRLKAIVFSTIIIYTVLQNTNLLLGILAGWTRVPNMPDDSFGVVIFFVNQSTIIFNIISFTFSIFIRWIASNCGYLSQYLVLFLIMYLSVEMFVL